MSKPCACQDMLFGSAMADAVMLDAAMIGVSGVEKKMMEFVDLYMDFRCASEAEANTKQQILTGFLITLAGFLARGAEKGDQNVQ